MLTIKDYGTALDPLPNHHQQLVILTMKEKTSQMIKLKQTYYFIYVLTDEPELHSLPTLDNDVKCTLYNLDILPTEVRTKLTKLKPDKASGPDLLKVNVLRNCLDFDIHLAYIFNKSIQTNQIPHDWRDGNVTPIHKKVHETSATITDQCYSPAK